MKKVKWEFVQRNRVQKSEDDTFSAIVCITLGLSLSHSVCVCLSLSLSHCLNDSSLLYYYLIYYPLNHCAHAKTAFRSGFKIGRGPGPDLYVLVGTAARPLVHYQRARSKRVSVSRVN